MSRPVRIANAQGFWGDRADAAREMLDLEPELDFLTLDYLAEVSMSILAVQQSRDASAGWARDFGEVVRSIAPYWRSGGRCRLITNAGGLNPAGCARACRAVLQQAGCGNRTIAVVSGDNVLGLIRSGNVEDDLLRNLDTGQSIAEVRDRLMTANAYLGAHSVAAAIQSGADLVITGRVADPSLAVAAAAYWFGWRWDDWDRLAGGTVAGHLIECGTQVTGGIATDWLRTPEADRIGFPIAEVSEDGSCVITRPIGSGGIVSQQTVKEQLVYEIGDPAAYLSPDVTVSLLSLQLEDEGPNRVRVRGAGGRAAPPTYKVSATYADGFRAQGQLTVFGRDAVAKARRAGQAVLSQLRASGVFLREAVIECLGAGACRPQGVDPVVAEQLTETVLRIAVADPSREAVERFSRELMPLVTAGPPGTTGYAEGRPKVHPLYRFWPCLIPRDRLNPHVQLLSPTVAATERDASMVGVPSAYVAGTLRMPSLSVPSASGANPDRVPTSSSEATIPARAGDRSSSPQRLGDISYGRSGDKGIHANIGLVARRAEDYRRLLREVTTERVASYLGLADAGLVTRYEMPNLGAMNFVVRNILACPLRVDAQGKALGQVLLEMPLEATA